MKSQNCKDFVGDGIFKGFVVLYHFELLVSAENHRKYFTLKVPESSYACVLSPAEVSL